jgi:transposase
VIDGPINGDLFTAYVEQVLVPTLAPGDIAILDNLGSHKGQRARRAIRQAGAILDLVSPVECANYLVNSGYASA